MQITVVLVAVSSVGALIAAPTAWYLRAERSTRGAWPRTGSGALPPESANYRAPAQRDESLGPRAPRSVRLAAWTSAALGALAVPWLLGAVWSSLMLERGRFVSGNELAFLVAFALAAWGGTAQALRRAGLARSLLRRVKRATRVAESVARRGLWYSAATAITSWGAAAYIASHARDGMAGLGDVVLMMVLVPLPIASGAVALAHGHLLRRAARESA